MRLTPADMSNGISKIMKEISLYCIVSEVYDADLLVSGSVGRN